MEIRVTCKSAGTLPHDRIGPLQGRLKKRTDEQIDKICRSIIKHGWAFPEFIWQHDGHNYCLDGNGTGGHRYPTLFHTSHPQLCGALRRSKKWTQVSAVLYGGNKVKSQKSIMRTSSSNVKMNAGYGGHFRAVQGFKFIGVRGEGK
jgi:hypothetical protein